MLVKTDFYCQESHSKIFKTVHYFIINVIVVNEVMGCEGAEHYFFCLADM